MVSEGHSLPFFYKILELSNGLKIFLVNIDVKEQNFDEPTQ